MRLQALRNRVLNLWRQEEKSSLRLLSVHMTSRTVLVTTNFSLVNRTDHSYILGFHYFEMQVTKILSYKLTKDTKVTKDTN